MPRKISSNCWMKKKETSQLAGSKASATPHPGRSLFWLKGELEARVGCAVDVLLVGEIRLQSKKEREGEMWTL